MRVKTFNALINELERRANVATPNTYESLSRAMDEIRYQDYLVVGGYTDYWGFYSRKEIVLSDAVGERVTRGYMKHILQKRPKFTLTDEVGDIDYIMDDVRLAIGILKLKEIFMDIGTNLIMNGWCHVLWEPETMDAGNIGGLSAKIFGFEECHPRHWDRDRSNRIIMYKAIYIPRPHGMKSRYNTLNEERYFNNPTNPAFQHLTRGSFNHGYGYARIQPVWDAITKLRERSDSEHFMKSIFMQIRYPAHWTPKKAKDFADKVRKATRRRGLGVEAVVNPQTQEDTGLPEAGYRPWAVGADGGKYDENKGSAYLDGEWLRLIFNLGYSQMWATGGNAGALEGSEINLTTDDRADISEFSYISPVFKKMLKRLAELGVMAAVGVSAESIELLLSENYEIIPWLTWEYNDKAAAQMAREEELMSAEEDRGGSDDRNDKKDNNIPIRYRTNKWITVDGGSKSARHIWVGGGSPPKSMGKGEISLDQWHDSEKEKIAVSLDYNRSANRLHKIVETYQNLNISNEEFEDVMFKLYNRVYKRKIKSKTKDFEDFKDRRFQDILDRKIKTEENRLKKLRKDPAKSKAAKERYKTSDLRYHTIMKQLDSKALSYDPKQIKAMMSMGLENDEIINDIETEQQAEMSDYGAGEIDWEEQERRSWSQHEGMRQYYETHMNKVIANSSIEFRHNEKVTMEIMAAIKLNMSYPFTPVMSSWIKEIGYDDQSQELLMTTHDNPGKVYPYPGEQTEQKYLDWSGSDSKGGFWWDTLQGTGSGAEARSSFSHLDTGFGAGLGDITEPTATREYKIEGGPGVIGAGETRDPFLFDAPKPLETAGGFNPSDAPQPMSTITSPTKAPAQSFANPKTKTSTNPKGAGRKSKPGRKPASKKPTSPYPVLYNAKLLSFKKFNEARKNESLATIGSTKYQRWRKHDLKYNSLAVGDVMNFDIDLWYRDNSGNPYAEKACKREWDKIENHEGNLWLYEDQGHGGERMLVGTYKYENGKTTFDYDPEIILENVPYESNIAARINKGLAPEISTEYYCGSKTYNGIQYQVEFHDGLGRPRFDGIAVVNYGNCGAKECVLEVIE